MAEPLARDEDRRADVEAERVVLERGSVALAHEEADEARVALLHDLLAAGEADAGGVHDRKVARHRIVQPDEAVIEDLNRLFRHALLHSAHVTSL